MNSPVLLDMTRAVGRRLKGQTPSGIDRVCDAYAARFTGRVLAVLQIRGRGVVLNAASSKALFSMLDAPTSAFRKGMLSILSGLHRSLAKKNVIHGAIYLNVSHSDFDLAAHWRFVRQYTLKPVYLLHDLIPLTHPHVTTPHKVARHRCRVRKALTGASGIIVTSQMTAGELRNLGRDLSIRLPKLLIAPIAGANLPIPLHPAIAETTYFVSIGTIETRKNHVLLLHAWSLLIDRLGSAVPKLILAGNWGRGSSKVRSILRQNPSLAGHVEIRVGLTDSDIAPLLANARGALLPTLAEGYGLPMVEALNMRVPVLASDLPIFHEVGQNIPLLLDSNDPAAWADAVMDLCNDGYERKRQLAALSGFRTSSWDSHFAALENWLDNPSGLGQSLWGGGAEHLPARNQEPDREAQC